MPMKHLLLIMKHQMWLSIKVCITYYSGVYPAGDVPSMAIGHAVSEDGITWVNDKKPVLESHWKPS